MRQPVGRHHARDCRFQFRLVDVEGTGRSRANLNLDRDGEAAALERAHDPAEAAQRHGTIAIGVGRLGPLHRAQQFLQQHAHVVVGPSARRTKRRVHDVGRRKVIAPQPDLDLQAHPGDCSIGAGSRSRRHARPTDATIRRN